ncbi:hypothetical protein F8388_003840 [Cannabis sativa]|uniref:Uncharacterized protein n=1 Tax=Cannabis sativa TaxID=3483 RepID=A0A7J6GNL5_CANSA|nr:hypothetical protein F8388_003840 [Cannabis sativa]
MLLPACHFDELQCRFAFWVLLIASITPVSEVTPLILRVRKNRLLCFESFLEGCPLSLNLFMFSLGEKCICIITSHQVPQFTLDQLTLLATSRTTLRASKY